MYELVSYVNGILGCELSENEDGLSVYIDRARAFLNDPSRISDSLRPETEQYFSLVRTYIDQIQDGRI
jgi:hypothetical protein